MQNIRKARNFIIGGLGIEYKFMNGTKFYSNLTQAYRPIQFANLQAPPTTDMVDPNLDDAKGYNFDLGYRGKIKNLMQFDVSGYYLDYRNRIGTITPNGTSYRLITNVGNSKSRGIESFFELNILNLIHASQKIDLLFFTSYSFTDAKYSNDYKDESTKGKLIENAPKNILRVGITSGYKSTLFTTQFS